MYQAYGETQEIGTEEAQETKKNPPPPDMAIEAKKEKNDGSETGARA